MHSYRTSRLSVRSDVVLPGLVTMPEGATSPDVAVHRHRVPATLGDATQKGPTWEIAGEQLLLRIPGVARFLLRAGHDISYDLEDGVPASAAATFILGTVFGILLHQRELIVLHASAACAGDKAGLFCGPSGAGKSTLAAALVPCGYSLLNDDFCAIGLDPAGAPLAHSDGRQLKLWAEAIERLDLADPRGAAVRSGLEKFYVAPQAASAEALPLGAVYMLRETRPPLRDGIQRRNLADAALLAAACGRYRTGRSRVCRLHAE